MCRIWVEIKTYGTVDLLGGGWVTPSHSKFRDKAGVEKERKMERLVVLFGWCLDEA